MDVKTKPAARPTAKRDDFLADIARPHQRHRVTYADGFRFGLGFMTARLLLALIVGGLAWGLVVALKLHG